MIARSTRPFPRSRRGGRARGFFIPQGRRTRRPIVARLCVSTNQYGPTALRRSTRNIHDIPYISRYDCARAAANGGPPHRMLGSSAPSHSGPCPFGWNCVVCPFPPSNPDARLCTRATPSTVGGGFSDHARRGRWPPAERAPPTSQKNGCRAWAYARGLGMGDACAAAARLSGSQRAMMDLAPRALPSPRHCAQ